MLNRARILILLLACLVVFGTLFQIYRFDERVKADSAREDAAIQQLHATDLALADARQAQAAYVAAGQGSAFWMTHFDEALARVEGTLRERQQTTQATGALAHYDDAIEQLEALRASDRRARNYVNNAQLILASDVIFVESQALIGRIAENLSAARDTEVFAARQSVATITQYRQALMAGGLLVTLLLLIVAPRKARREEPVEMPDTVSVAPEPSPRPIERTPALDDAADVCVDIARLLDGRDLPAILTRAASAIDAKGLVLWVVDEQGQSLRASMAHGYPDRMLTRLGHLPVAADNVTSLACRTLQPQLVPGADLDSSGALAVPLIGTTGCVGVLSAEVSGPRANGHQVSVARLIAAQLSAVIRPDAAAMPSSIAQ
ncbi:MAG TPA: GAF domain-containing protein [Vicinamibacterales bacterium]|nr:GAF domain-containing protein [Vicinamibacterales bacterium]